MARCISIIAFLLAISSPALANVGGGSGVDLSSVRDRIEHGKYKPAIERLQALLAEHPDNADIYNLLGYSHRKLGHYEQAERYYLKALQLEPGHPGANEYLGELYLETGRPELARERLQVLDDGCWYGCEAYEDLKAAIQAYEGQSP